MKSLVQRARLAFPAGVELGPEEWDKRHGWIRALLVAHVPFIVAFAFVRGGGAAHNLAESLPVGVLALLASSRWLARRARAIAAGLGLMTASAVLVHLAGGSVEMHFHFFVMLGVISLYQDWRPFLVSIAFVAAHHGIGGSLFPEDVFDHAAAWNAPLKWAAVHAMFVLAACAVSVVSWRIVEDGHRRSRAAIEDSERRFRALIEHSGDVVTVVDADGRIVYDSPSCSAVLGYSPEERLGAVGVSFIHPDDGARAEASLARVFSQRGTVVTVELRVRHRDGTYRWVEANVTNLLDEPSVNGIVANFRDVTDRKALEEQLAHQAFHDPMTGLANRALLLDRVERALAASVRRSSSVALIYVDLDDFKTVNDGLGHEAGDSLLRVVGQRIDGALRAGDTAARLGGDEFAVLVEDVPSPVVAYEIGARILEALGEPVEIEGTTVTPMASIGIAVSEPSDDAAALLRNADLAMYQAKGGGKGRFTVYEAGMHAAVVERMALKADLRRAVDAGEFEAHYQPIVDLQSGRMAGVEALVRWHHPHKGLVSPAEFIPLAEETGLIMAIGRVVLTQACLDAAEWRATLGDRAPATVSVNLSARQIQDPQLVSDVAAALTASRLPASALILEITESILIDDAESAARTLDKLKGLGVSIALDDFGTGYSSLSHLDRFPVDVVKIDKSFVDALTSDESGGSPLVTAIVNLGALLGLGVTAEGIERGEQVTRLRDMGCSRGQGYYFAKPVPADAVAALARAVSADAPRRIPPRPGAGADLSAAQPVPESAAR